MTGLEVKYSKLFSALMQQPFYLNGICANYKTQPILDYDILPTKECRNILNRLEMVLKIDHENGGLSIWSRTNGKLGPNDLLFFKPKVSDVLRFIVSLKNPSFLNFNDINVNYKPNLIYYFNNRIEDASSPRDNLHISMDTGGVNDSDLIKKLAISYQYIHGTNLPPGSAKLRHLDSGFEIFPKNLINISGQAHVTFDMSNFPVGLCEIIIGGLSVDKAYHTGALMDIPIFAVLEFSLDILSPANYRIIESDGTITPERPIYTMLFNNRRTFWRYKVLLTENSPLFREIDQMTPADKAEFYDKMNIISNDTGVTFQKQIVSDRHFEFVSETELPLMEKYFSASSSTNDSLSLALKKYIGDPIMEANVKLNLPYPSNDQLDSIEAPVLYSNILLNI